MLSSRSKSNLKKLVPAFSKTVFDTLLQAYRPYLMKILFVSIFGFIGRLLFLSFAQKLAQSSDLHSNLNLSQLKPLIESLFIVLVISFTLTTIYRTVFSRLSALAVSRIYDEATYRVSRYSLSFFDSHPVGRITTRFSSDYGNVFRLFGGPLAEFLSIIFDLISIFILIALTHHYFLFNLILATLAFYFILKLNQKKLRQIRRKTSQQRAPSVAHFSETVQGSLSIRQSGFMDSFTNRFVYLDQLYIQSKFEIIKGVMTFSTQLNLISSLLFIANGFAGLYLIKNQTIGAGQVAINLAFTLLATNTLQMFFEWYSQFEEALVGVERLDEFIRLPIEEGAFLPLKSDFKTHHPRLINKYNDHSEIVKNNNLNLTSDYKLEVHQLFLKYDSQQSPTLKNISFKLKENEKLGIIGRTGSGKSSLISALLKLYPLSQGFILLNNEINPNIEEHRKQFSLISQDQFFIQGYLRDNLDLFQHESNSRLIEILKTVGLHLDLNHRIDEKGQNLSQGEKQLISLARGLLQNAEVFIFDEATANIDPQSEQLIELALKKTLAHKTQIRIAHRLETVVDCDQVLWLESGEVKMLGPTEQILKAFREYSNV